MDIKPRFVERECGIMTNLQVVRIDILKSFRDNQMHYLTFELFCQIRIKMHSHDFELKEEKKNQ